MSTFDARNEVVASPSSLAKLSFADRSLKGLLMDKGRAGLDKKRNEFLRRIILVQDAMESLVDQQRYSRENSGCDCLTLYFARNLKTGRDRVEAEKLKLLSASEVQLNHTKGAATLEWRACKTFASFHGYAYLARINAFNPQHNHYLQVREFVDTNYSNYYEVLAGYDAVRVSLNYAIKSLRKTMFDLNALWEETQYPDEVEHEATIMSRRIFKALPESESVSSVLNQLYS